MKHDKIMRKMFPGQFPNERVIFLIRRHWSLIVKQVVRLILAHIVLAAVYAFLFYLLQWELPNEGPLYILSVIAVSAYLLGAWLLYLYEFVDYHLDIWILTDRRIINIEQEGLFKRTVSELDLAKVQDVTSECKGKIQTFLNYGYVHIQTAAETQRFVFEQVPNPQNVARQIIHTVEEFNKNLLSKQFSTAQQKYNETAPPVKTI